MSIEYILLSIEYITRFSHTITIICPWDLTLAIYSKKCSSYILQHFDISILLACMITSKYICSIDKSNLTSIPCTGCRIHFAYETSLVREGSRIVSNVIHMWMSKNYGIYSFRYFSDISLQFSRSLIGSHIYENPKYLLSYMEHNLMT